MSHDLAQDIETFLKTTGIAPTALGRDALGDPSFVKDLRNGRRLWPETEAKVREFMRSHSKEAAN